jgi:3-oxoacyl-[acyl-carrier protein] reductase
MDLKQKSVLVTGGSSGIGRAIAASLIDAGARVVINGRDEGRLNSAAAELGCVAAVGDVADEATAKSLVQGCVDEHGGLDILINNAGFGVFRPLLETSADDVESVWRTNVLGAFLMGREAARHMVEGAKPGAIVNIASTAALKGFARGTAYAGSKFALRGMSECWRDELRRHDIRVLLVNPSEVLTDFSRNAGGEQQYSEKKLHAEDIAHAVRCGLEMDQRGFIPELSVFATNPF